MVRTARDVAYSIRAGEAESVMHLEALATAYLLGFEQGDKYRDAITAALDELKRNKGTPRLGLRGATRILMTALEGSK